MTKIIKTTDITLLTFVNYCNLYFFINDKLHHNEIRYKLKRSMTFRFVAWVDLIPA